MSRFKSRRLQHSAISHFEDAKAEVESLREEIANWKAGLEGTNLENSQKYEDLDVCEDVLTTAVDSLEGIDTDCLGELDGEFTAVLVDDKNLPRWARLANAVTQLQTAAEAAAECASLLRDEETELEGSEDEADDLRREATMYEDLESEISAVCDELDKVTFPEMY